MAYRAVVQIDDVVVYESLSDAARAYGVRPSKIADSYERGTRCQGKRWRYKIVEEPEQGGLIVCDQTGDKFASVAAAAKAFGVRYQELWDCVLGVRGPIDGRFTFTVENHRGVGEPERWSNSKAEWAGPVNVAHMSRSGKQPGKGEVRSQAEGEPGGESKEENAESDGE